MDLSKKKKRDIKILFFLLIFLLIINYPFLDRALKNFLDDTEVVHVDRIIDGDTIESNKTSIRLLGINTPERGEFLYQEAKDFLSSLILNQNVTLEFTKERTDKYNRTLAYIWLNNTNINVAMVKNGFATYYFYDGRDKYSGDLEQAWTDCLKNETNLCEPSTETCAVSKCIEIIPYLYISNVCPYSCNINGWTIKGEGREKFVFNQSSLAPGATTGFSLVMFSHGLMYVSFNI